MWAAASTSSSPAEKEAEKYFLDYFSKQDYFAENPQYYGAYPIRGDAFDRATVWAMAKGEGPETVVMIHHYDVVTVEDYKNLKDLAYSPEKLEIELQKVKDGFGAEARADLESGKWLFGRGVCDMKGGGSIQMTLVSEYAKKAAARPIQRKRHSRRRTRRGKSFGGNEGRRSASERTQGRVCAELQAYDKFRASSEEGNPRREFSRWEP